MSRTRVSMLGVFVSLCCVSVVQAQQSNVSNETSVAGSFPRLVRFSGTLPERRGASASVTAARVSFAVYEDQAGGAALWSEVQDVRVDAQGRYSVLLGAASSDGLPAELFSTGGPRWLGVQVEGRGEEARVLLVAVPYALKAADADTLGGKPATAYVASDQLKEQVQSEVKAQVTESGSATRTLVGTAPTPQAIGEGKSSFLCNVTTDCVTVTQSGSGVGLHSTTPTGNSVLGELSGTTGAAVYGRATAGSGAASAVQGDAAAPNAVGVLGRSFGTTGTSKGVFGRTFSTSGTGVHGDATTTTGATRGVWGTTVSTGGVGVYGQSAAATGFTTGVSGTVASTSGVAVYGQANATSGSTIGVQAKVLSASGTALVADNTNAGGKLISGRSGTLLDEKFSVDGSGNVDATTVVASGGATGVSGVGDYSGVYGAGDSIGVEGHSGTGIGVYGLSSSSYGIEGHSASNIGVAGFGAINGVYGYSTNTAVFGQAGGTGSGVRGYSLTYGSTGTLGTQDGFGASTGVYGVGSYGVRATGYDRGVYATSTNGYGVYATSTNYTGVYASGGTFGIGVHGYTPSGYGVYGSGDNGVRGECFSWEGCTGVAGIGGSNGTGTYGYSSGGYGVYSDGAFAASGSKSAVVALPDNRVVELYAMESPEVWFEDFGSVVLANGIAHVTLESTFEQTVNTGLNYYVFLTPNGETNGLYVAQKSPNGFQIREANGGRSNVPVDYRIVARRRGFENVRLQEVDADEEAVAAVRAQNRARPGRATLRIPKKLAAPQAPRPLTGSPGAEARLVSP